VTDRVDRRDIVVYALRLGDDALILSHRLAEWSSRAPVLEEDVALTNIGLDLLGQARALLTYAGEVEGAGRTEDDLAYLRPDGEFTNCQLVEQRNGDFALTMARQLFFSAYQAELYQRLAQCTEPTLAAVAAQAAQEVD
jgi:ring-1,2-phenylacetyl-CoA epoxidase subunit PaaC